MAEATPMPMCPMAETCKGIMEKPFPGLVLIIPGIAFIILGVLIVIEPRILVWLVAVLFAVMGIMMLLMANFVRKIGARMHGA